MKRLLLLAVIVLALIPSMALAVNVLSNPGFEIGTDPTATPWSVGSWGEGNAVTNASIAHTGQRCWQVTNTDGTAGSYTAANFGCVQQMRPCKAGDTFQLSVWVKVPAATASYKPMIRMRYGFFAGGGWASGPNYSHDVYPSNGGWFQMTAPAPITAPADATSLLCRVYVYRAYKDATDAVVVDQSGAMFPTYVDDFIAESSDYYSISGSVTSGGSPLAGATVNVLDATTGIPAGSGTTDAAGQYSAVASPGNYNLTASKVGYQPNPAWVTGLSLASDISGQNFALTPSTTQYNRAFPRESDLLFANITEMLPDPAPGLPKLITGPWPTYKPQGLTQSSMNNPKVEVIGGVKWVENSRSSSDGFVLGTYSSPIPVNGVTAVAMVKPVRGNPDAWTAVLSLLFDRLTLCVRNDNGEVGVHCNGTYTSAGIANALPEGLNAVLSVVVQPDSSYKVYANGSEILSVAAPEPAVAYTSLVPNVAGGFANAINIGRNNPDAWSSFNGFIGDVLVYKVALTPAEREAVESDLANKFGMQYAITASAGANGSITPSGIQFVNGGSDQTFTFTPNAGYVINKVLVDGVANAAAKVSGSYTFTNVGQNHTISVTFADPDADPSLLIDLQASSLTVGEDLASWPNAGIIGGSFDKFENGVGPNVTMIAGKKAVEFIQADSSTANRRTLASSIPAPVSLSGNNPWTISSVLYRYPNQPGGDNAYFQWAGGSYLDGQSAIFNYTDNRAYMHWGNDSGFQTVPSAGGWHSVTVTYDGTTESIYVDGVHDKSDARTLSINPGGLMMVGGRTWHDMRGEDQYWRYNGAIASIKVFDRALTSEEVAVLASFTKHTITVTTGSNGTITPGPGDVSITENDSPTFIMVPDFGYKVADVVVDGQSVGAVSSYTFDNVVSAHTISATFEALPESVVSGKVTDGTTGIVGAKVYFKQSANASSNPKFVVTTDAEGNYSKSVPVGDWFVAASADGFDLSGDSNVAVTTALTAVPDIVLAANPYSDVLFFATVDGFSGVASGTPTGNWTTGYPAGSILNSMGDPMVADLDGYKMIENLHGEHAVPPTGNDGFELAGVPFNVQPNGGVDASGVSVVTVVQPKYLGNVHNNNTEPDNDRGEIVSLYYNGLSVGVRHSTGELIVARKSWDFKGTGAYLFEGKKSILSFVAQLDGSCKLYVDAVEVWSGEALGTNYYADLTGSDGRNSWMNKIGVGRNPYDGWSSFNGYIGDVYVYKTAISDAKRQAMQSSLAAKFGVTIPTFTTISGKVTLNDGVTPIAGVSVSDENSTVKTAVDGTYVLDVETDSYAFVTAFKDSYMIVYPSSGMHEVPVGQEPVVNVNFRMTPIDTITGIVKDTNGNPVYNAVVQFKGGPAAITDMNGRYTVAGIDPSVGELYVDALGYGHSIQSVDTSAAATGLYQLNDVVLTPKNETGVLQNGGFEAVSGGIPTGWQKWSGQNVTFTADSEAYSGLYSAFVTATSSYHFMYQEVEVIPGSTYNCYFKLKADPEVNQCFPMPAFRSASGSEVMATVSAEPGYEGYVHNPPKDWHQYLRFNVQGTPKPFVRLAAPEGATKLTVIFGFEAVPAYGKGIYVDDVVIDRVGPEVTTITGKVVSSTGLPISNAAVFVSDTTPVVSTAAAAVTDENGNYTVSVVQDKTYYLNAKKGGYASSANDVSVVLGAVPASAANIVLTESSVNKLIDLKAADYNAGVWVNKGSLGGSFSSTEATAPAKSAVGSYDAVVFDGTQRLLGSVTAPASITGNGSFTVSSWLYGAPGNTYGSYFAWVKGMSTNLPASACFLYDTEAGWGAIDFGGVGMGLGASPAAGKWHNVAVTYDHNMLKVYVDGVMTNSRKAGLDQLSGQPFSIGSAYSNDDGSSLQWPFTGSIASIEVFDADKDANAIAAMFTAGPTGVVAKPYGVNNKTVLTDDKLVGKVVKVWGKVISVSGTSYVISDGYSTGVTVHGGMVPAVGNMSVVTGVVNADKSITAMP